ncbi:RNA-directed DNA polymerase, eukaryota [Tanacetum coccineum]
MGFRPQNSLQSKFDHTSKISKSVFITNFPDDCSSKDIWKVCKDYGTVIDVFIPNKKSKAGKRFAFVRFIRVLNFDRLIENLKTIWIGSFHLFANPVRFERPKAHTIQNEKPVAPVFISLALSLLEGCSFMVSTSQSDFVAKERLVWVDIEGVPLNAWSRSTFQKIGSKWGEMVELEDGGRFFGARAGTFCLVSSFVEVLEKEPIFGIMNQLRINRNGNNINIGEEENDSEIEVSSDPFNIYGLLDKHTKDVRKTGTPTNIPYPPGFTPADGSTRLFLNKISQYGSGLNDIELEGILFTWLTLGHQDVFKKKLHLLKEGDVFRTWIMDFKRHQMGLSVDLKSKLCDIDKTLDQGGVSEEILLSRMEVLKQLHDVQSFSSRDIMQKAKIRWVIVVDENSK